VLDDVAVTNLKTVYGSVFYGAKLLPARRERKALCLESPVF